MAIMDKLRGLMFYQSTPEKALPYSGLAYMAGVVDLGERGSLPQFNFEIRGKLLDTGDGIDVNPADYIVHVLKSIGIDDVSIDGLDNYRAYCKAADILISTPPDSKSSKAQNVINDIAEITNSLVFWSTDRLKIVPLADKPIGDWSPVNQIQYNLTADDLIPASDGQLLLCISEKIARKRIIRQQLSLLIVPIVMKRNGIIRGGSRCAKRMASNQPPKKIGSLPIY